MSPATENEPPPQKKSDPKKKIPSPFRKPDQKKVVLPVIKKSPLITQGNHH